MTVEKKLIWIKLEASIQKEEMERIRLELEKGPLGEYYNFFITSQAIRLLTKKELLAEIRKMK